MFGITHIRGLNHIAVFSVLDLFIRLNITTGGIMDVRYYNHDEIQYV